MLLSGWAFSTDREKRERFACHLRSAADAGLIEEAEKFVHSLSSEDWHKAPDYHLDWSYGDALSRETEERDRAIGNARQHYKMLREVASEPAYEQAEFFETLWCYYLLFATDGITDIAEVLERVLRTYSELANNPNYNFFDGSVPELAADTCREFARRKKIEVEMIKILLCISQPDSSGRIQLDRDAVGEFLDEVFSETK